MRRIPARFISATSDGHPHARTLGRLCHDAHEPVCAKLLTRRGSNVLGLNQSCRMTPRRELWIDRPPLYSMKPSLLNLFMKWLTRDRVVPMISASVS